MVVRQLDAPAKKWAMGCASLDRQWWRSEGMSQPNGATPNRWVGSECAGKRRDQIGGECAGQTKQHQIGGGSAGNAPAKRSNTKSVAARRGMRRPNGTTPNRWISGECAGKRRDCGTTMGCTGRTKRMRRGDEMRRLNEKTKARRRMHRPNKKWRRGDGMHRPNKETAAR
jgi:hypothetical protein